MHAVRLAPHDPDGLMALGVAQVRTGSISEAVEILQRARQAFLVAPSYFQQYYAMTHWAAGDYMGAIDAANKCLIQTPKYVPCWVEKIVAQVDAGRVVGALASANTIWPEFAQADVQLLLRGFSSAQPMLERRFAAATLVGIAGSVE